MKKNQGISLIELVIVIIILILIAGFAVFNGRNTIEKADATELFAEMTNMKKAVSSVIIKKDLESGDDNWLKDYYDEVVNKDKSLYLIYGMDNNKYKSSNVRKNIDMDVIKRSYIVNYETGEVTFSEAIEVLGNSVRTYDSLRAIIESEKL